MNNQQERIANLLREHSAGLSTAQIAEFLGRDMPTTSSMLSKGVHYGWWLRTPCVLNGHHQMLWKAPEDRAKAVNGKTSLASAPARIKLSRAPGFSLQAHSRSINGLAAAKVDRTTSFGNPYRIGEAVDLNQMRRWGWDISPKGRAVVCADAIQAVIYFSHALLWDHAIHDHIRQKLGGRNIACWCDPQEKCHGDPLLWLANSTEEQVRAIQDGIDNRIFRVAQQMSATETTGA